MGLIDTHCHLNDDTYIGQIDKIIQECHANDIEKLIVIGYDLNSSIKAVALANQYDELYAAVGIHPSDADCYDEYIEETLVKLVNENPKVIAIGEIGLDYHYEDVNRAIQKETFEKQIALAKRVHLPIIVHTRDAMEDTITITQRYSPLEGVMHCFSGSVEMAERFMKQGFYISLAGPVTFKNANTPKAVAKVVPLDRLLVETDCPYLTPMPFRGKLNYPYYVRYVATEIAQLRGISLAELTSAERANVKALFKI